MYYSQNVIEKIRIENDIVDVINGYTSLKQKGNSYFGLCPFHTENTPSFSVSPDKQLYHCFGCGASGNVIGFIMQAENCDFVDAIKYLAQRINYDIPEDSMSDQEKANKQIKEILFKIHKKAARYFYDNLSSLEGKKALRYLDKRNISLPVRKKYGLGYSGIKRNSLFDFLKKQGFETSLILKSGLVIKGKNGECYDRFINRIMFPIIDVQDRIIAFGGRAIGNSEPKYLNSPETDIFSKSHNLYSINFAKKTKMKEFIIVEGYMDVISLYQYGIKNAVAALGTAFNDSNAKLLKRYAESVILLFDSDKAGVNAVLRAIPFLTRNGIKPKVLQVENAKDPDEYINKFGATAFCSLIENKCKNYISFQVEQIKKQYNINDTEQKIKFVNDIVKLLSSLDNEIEIDVYAKEISKITNISYAAIKREINKNNYINTDEKRYSKSVYLNKKENKKGINDARKNIINVLASNIFVYNALKDELSAEEFVEPLYVKLVNIIYNMYSKDNVICPAEIVSFFETPEQQQEVSNILLLQSDTETDKELEKAVNDRIRLIKEAYIDDENSKTVKLIDEAYIKNENSKAKVYEEKLKTLKIKRKNINKLYINIF